MIEFLSRYEAEILYLFLPIEILTVFCLWIFLKFFVILFTFRRTKDVRTKHVIHLFSVIPFNLLKLYGRDSGRRAQRRQEKQLVELASGKMGERISDMVVDLPDALAELAAHDHRRRSVQGGVSSRIQNKVAKVRKTI